MKRLITLLSSLSLLVFLVACGGNENSSSDPNDSTRVEGDNQRMSESEDMANSAVCLWPTVGLRDKPGRSGAEYLTGIKFGETVSLTGEEEEIKSEKRTYLKVKLKDGQEGWANEYLFALGAKPVVAVADIDIFKRPDLSTLTTEKIGSGTLFAVKNDEEQEGWAEVATLEKSIEGWIKFDSELFTDDPIDIALGKVLTEVRGMESTSAKLKKLESVASSSTFSGSSLMPMVSELMAQLDKSANLPNTQLMITANKLNVRSEPDNTADNVIFQLDEGDICEILQRGEAMVEIKESKDYWYQIEKDGQIGWVFGAYTSKRQ